MADGRLKRGVAATGRGARVTGRGVRGAGRFATRVTEPDPRALRRRVRVDPDWRRVDADGYAARLTPEQTIEVTRRGRFRNRDPLKVQVGWHESGRALGVAAWAAVIGVAWWAGRRGVGPLSMLEDSDHRW